MAAITKPNLQAVSVDVMEAFLSEEKTKATWKLVAALTRRKESEEAERAYKAAQLIWQRACRAYYSYIYKET